MSKIPPPPTPEKYIRTRARSLPIGTCYINVNWQTSGMATIIVTRLHSNHNITFGLFLVDLYCLGVKDTFWKFNDHPIDFQDFLENRLGSNTFGLQFQETDYILVHNIIYGAIEFADDFGFKPHADFELTRFILEEDDEQIDLIDLEFGHNGKPLFISNPDNPVESRRVMAHLEKFPGLGNFKFIAEADRDDFLDGLDQQEETGSDDVLLEEFIDYHDPGIKKQVITEFLSLCKSTEEKSDTTETDFGQMLTDSEIIYYKYMLKDEDIKIAADKISTLFDFEISDELLSDEMLSGNALVKDNREGINLVVKKIFTYIDDDNFSKWRKEAEAAMKRHPDILVFKYLYLRYLQVKGSEKDFHRHVLANLEKNPTYYPFVILTAIDFLTYNPENITRSISENLYLRNFFPQRNSFCEEELRLFIQALTLDFTLNGKYALLDEMYNYLDEEYTDLVDEEQMVLVKLLKVPDVGEWCSAWVQNMK